MFRIELKKLRENNGLSQYKLADILGDSQSAVGLWESGRREPNFDTLCRIADLFHVSTDHLLGVPSRFENIAPSQLSIEDSELLLKFHALDTMAQARILNSLDFEYQSTLQENAKSSISLA